MTWRTPELCEWFASSTRYSVSPWIEELEGGCEQVDVWRHSPITAVKRNVVEEVCGRTESIHQMSVINSHSHHRQLSLHKQPRKQRADALMLSSSCLDGSITRVGPG